MTRYAALLRGIYPSNPSMSNDKLRGVLAGLGLDRVSSVLASGNILFETRERDVPGLEDEIQQALVEQLGIRGGTVVRTLEELRGLLESDPFPGLTHGRGTYLTVTFLKDGAAAAPEIPEPTNPLVQVVGFDPGARAFLAVIENSDPGRTPGFMAWLDRTYGADITTRTWLTVQRIVARLEAP